jgi:hypothetical protein
VDLNIGDVGLAKGCNFDGNGDRGVYIFAERTHITNSGASRNVDDGVYVGAPDCRLEAVSSNKNGGNGVHAGTNAVCGQTCAHLSLFVPRTLHRPVFASTNFFVGAHPMLFTELLNFR